MKNLIKFFMVLAVLCAVAACSQTTEGKQEATKGRLVMNVKSESRTIMPEINENDIKSATLTANEDEIKSWSGADVISQLESDNSILLVLGIYDFEMTFCNENGDVILKDVIENQEIVAGDNCLVFNMKLVQGKGNIAIGLSWEAISGISKIKAGLYHIATGEAVTGYEAEEIAINGTQAEYVKNDVPTGQYIIKFEIYDVTKNKLLNTLTDVIKVIGEMTTSDQKVLSKINTQYTITYDLDGGSWQTGFTPVTVRNANTGITLPTADNIERADYDFIGWYDENGDKVTQIPSDMVKDITVTAKWYSDFVYVQGATITGAITAEGYTTSNIFKDSKTVTVGNFYICDHEVTQAEYEKYCSYGGAKPSDKSYGVGSNYPAYYVSWYDALVYCNKRSIAEGLTPCYTIKSSTDPDDWGSVPTSSSSTWNSVTCDFTANGYRLPTLAEWEYAARGGKGLTGTQYEYAGSNSIDNVAWYTGNSGSKTHEVKGKAANGLGLYDMSGNVWEWCWDSNDSGDRFIRGGSWDSSAGGCRVSYRSFNNADNRLNDYGFRVVRTAK